MSVGRNTAARRASTRIRDRPFNVSTSSIYSDAHPPPTSSSPYLHPDDDSDDDSHFSSRHTIVSRQQPTSSRYNATTTTRKSTRLRPSATTSPVPHSDPLLDSGPFVLPRFPTVIDDHADMVDELASDSDLSPNVSTTLPNKRRRIMPPSPPDLSGSSSHPSPRTNSAIGTPSVNTPDTKVDDGFEVPDLDQVPAVEETDDDASLDEFSDAGGGVAEEDMDDDAFIDHLMHEHTARQTKQNKRARTDIADTEYGMDALDALIASRSKRPVPQTTSEERALKHAEQIRRRDLVKQQRIDDLKETTIHRLLKKQASKKTRSEQAEERRAELMAIQQKQHSLASIRYVDNAQKTVVALPKGMELSQVFPARFPKDMVVNAQCDRLGCANLGIYKFDRNKALVRACSLPCYKVLKHNE